MLLTMEPVEVVVLVGVLLTTVEISSLPPAPVLAAPEELAPPPDVVPAVDTLLDVVDVDVSVGIAIGPAPPSVVPWAALRSMGELADPSEHPSTLIKHQLVVTTHAWNSREIMSAPDADSGPTRGPE